jgi:hypothetical protein
MGWSERRISTVGLPQATRRCANEARRGRGASVLLERANTLVGQDRKDKFLKRTGELV